MATKKTAERAGGGRRRRDLITEGIDPRKVLALRSLLKDLAILSTIDKRYIAPAQAAGALAKALGDVDFEGDALS